MADYLHKLPASDPFWTKQAFWDEVQDVLDENERVMQEMATKRKFRRRLFRKQDSTN